jgi:hypothetical protein
LDLQTELHEERDRSRNVVDYDADVIHPLNRQIFTYSRTTGGYAVRVAL